MSDSSKLHKTTAKQKGPVHVAIAQHARAYIPDGATLQTGIGVIPSAIAALLADGDGGDYGIHSEMFTDGLMRLHQAGKVSNARKGLFDGVSVATFAQKLSQMPSCRRYCSTFDR